MTTATVDRPEAQQKPTIHDRIVDAFRQGAHISHERRLFMSVAEDAIEDGVHAARRAGKAARRRAEDLGDDATHYVRRHPAQAVAVTFATGLAMGLAAGWIARRPGTA